MKIIKNITKKQYISFLKRPFENDKTIFLKVKEIMASVKQNGDESLIEFTKTFDGKDIISIEVSEAELKASEKFVSEELKEAVSVANSNIEKFHKAQLPINIDVETLPGVNCFLKYLPIEKVGLYIPGGTAPLISTILMLAIPAKIAGCKEIIVCSPPDPSNEILYVCNLLGIRLFRVGGAQAIAAMAFGTNTIPKVDKIFGPGNRFVTEAKVQASALGIPIDIPAGPSEVLIVADESSNPSFVAADLLSQAEHGTDSQVVLISTSSDLINKILEEVNIQIEQLPRKNIAKKCLENSVAIITESIESAIEISNFYAPEHLILSINDAENYINKITSAGSVFLGEFSPESAGDYASGTNHTLPTGGFARNWSGVTVQSFMKSITFQQLSKAGLESISSSITTLARAEGLEAHAKAIDIRL